MSRPEPFALERSQPREGVQIIGLRGELDFAQAAMFRTALLTTLGEAADAVVLDLSALEFIDSSGIGAIIYAARAATRDGQVLIVASPSEQADRVFRMLNLSEVVTIEPDVETALRRVGCDGNSGRSHAAH